MSNFNCRFCSKTVYFTPADPKQIEVINDICFECYKTLVSKTEASATFPLSFLPYIASALNSRNLQKDSLPSDFSEYIIDIVGDKLQITGPRSIISFIESLSNRHGCG